MVLRLLLLNNGEICYSYDGFWRQTEWVWSGKVVKYVLLNEVNGYVPKYADVRSTCLV